jgi:hypothetical protein
MSSRLHNKYHRHNHHTVSTVDPRYPDSGHDPIASPDSPFLGAFVLNGTLSASGLPNFSQITSTPAGVFTSYPTAIQAVAVSGNNIGNALEVTGNITGTGSLSLQGSVSAANVVFTGLVSNTYDNVPLQSTGEFLTLNVNGVDKLIRLWSLQ